jgi:hypothetical protein
LESMWGDHLLTVVLICFVCHCKIPEALPCACKQVMKESYYKYIVFK